MERFLVYIAILVALSFMLFGPVSSAFGQGVTPTQRCDVFVNRIRITFPSNFLNQPQCFKLMLELQAKDTTGAAIECRCLEGSKI